MPETLIGNDPDYYLEYTLASWTKTRDLTPFAPEALAHYRVLMTEPSQRACHLRGLSRRRNSIDRKLDEADKAAGRKIACPTLVIYASDYLAGGPLDVWRPWCGDVRAPR